LGGEGLLIQAGIEPGVAALFGGVLGLIVGSFLATMVVRWPKDQSITSGRSRCDGCSRILGLADLVPLFSFVVRRGRCATCQARIDPVHFWIELACGFLGAVLLAFQPTLVGLCWALFAWLLVALAVFDLRHFWLPDALVGAVALSGLALLPFTSGAPAWEHWLAGLGAYAVLAAIAWVYRRVRGRDGMGGGDPKLLGAIAVWIGWQDLPMLVLVASIVALIGALVMFRGDITAKANVPLPFGTALIVATGLVAAAHQWMVVIGP
jgi:leader peptidase (prepilin peptidase) / N-methyltransferase